MKVVVLAPQTPYPPRQGAALRNYHLLRALAGRDDVSLLAFDPTPTDGALEHLETFCERVELLPAPAPRPLYRRAVESLASPLPDMARRLQSHLACVRLSRLLARTPADILHAEGIEMAGLALAMRSAVTRGFVFDDHNAEYMLQRRVFETDLRARRFPGAVYSFLQSSKLARYERTVMQAARAVTCVSEADQRYLSRLTSTREPKVIPNGIDVASYRFVPVTDRPRGTDLLFTGTMDYRPNVDAAVWFAEAIMPLVRRHRPDAQLKIVGRNPAPRVRRLEGPSIQVVGSVPDVRPYLESAGAYVCPLRMGSGTRFKVLEAMASGIPVITTSVGSEGLGAKDGRELLIAEDPGAFAAAIGRALDDDSASMERANRALALVRCRFDWKVLTPRLTQLYEAIECEGDDGAR